MTGQTIRELAKNVSYIADHTQIVRLGSRATIGGKQICLIAGPCALESEEQFLKIVEHVLPRGAVAIRGGVYKPRTSPYSFQGLGAEGISVLERTRSAVDAPIVSEVTDVRQLDAMSQCVDVFQVGTRNMYNYTLLKELGGVQKPVLLKRGMMATVEEFLNAAEYVLSHGNNQVILCERGIRSFDSVTRFCLDLSVIPVLKARTKLPVVVDPSHATGNAEYVEPMALAAVAAGADGLLVEVHCTPGAALSDGAQSLSFEQYDALTQRLGRVAQAVGRSF